jgi:hypothetical protein
MTLLQVSTKIDLRLNKSASSDYDNLWPYVKEEAFNKAISESIRKLVRGKNDTQEGDEETTSRVDDLQVLLKSATLPIRERDLYVETSKLPDDYLYFKRLTPYVSKAGCTPVGIKSHLREEANVDELVNTLPSFNFEETFHTLIGNKAHVYHNKDFKIDKISLTYYRKPKEYSFKKEKLATTVVEFKEDLCNIIVDEAVQIIASDIESINQKVLAEARAKGST